MGEALKNGVHRCPHCGSSDVSLSAKDGELKCNFCRTVFKGKLANPAGGVETLRGEVRGDGAGDIIPGEDIVVSFKCSSCGAEVVVNTEESLDASCHWCKHIFTVNEKLKNGAVPDLVLPFKLTKAKAQEKARECIDNMGHVNEDFRKSFEKDGLRGVYFPYFIVDVNARMELHGMAEKTVSVNNSFKERASLYKIDREFSVYIDDLTVESSSARLNQDTMINSNNIINAILPFDTENAVAWDANYLRGFASERRSVDIDKLKEVVALQSGDIARLLARDLIIEYDRGARWEKEHLGIKGTRWKTAYLPVWLFSYRSSSGKDTRIYYVAVNARTGEAVGCAPGNTRFTQLSSWGPDAETLVERHHHELETRAKIGENDRVIQDEMIFDSIPAVAGDIPGRNDSRVIGALSTGRGAMSSAEKARFAMGSNYTNANRGSGRGRKTAMDAAVEFVKTLLLWLVIIFFFVLMICTDGGGGGSGSSYSSSDYSWSDSSSYDSGWSSSDSSFDSGGGDFSYSYDY